MANKPKEIQIMITRIKMIDNYIKNGIRYRMNQAKNKRDVESYLPSIAKVNIEIERLNGKDSLHLYVGSLVDFED